MRRSQTERSSAWSGAVCAPSDARPTCPHADRTRPLTVSGGGARAGQLTARRAVAPASGCLLRAARVRVRLFACASVRACVRASACGAPDLSAINIAGRQVATRACTHSTKVRTCRMPASARAVPSQPQPAPPHARRHAAQASRPTGRSRQQRRAMLPTLRTRRTTTHPGPPPCRPTPVSNMYVHQRLAALRCL